MLAVDSTPQFIVLSILMEWSSSFGNAVGFAVFDIPSGLWNTTQLTIASSVSMANLLNQQGMGASAWQDGYTISVFVSSPQTYMQLETRNMTMDGVSVPGFK